MSPLSIDRGGATRRDQFAARADAPGKLVLDEIVPRGEVATWRAARAVGDHDLNTLLIRVDPVSDAAALQSGMSIWLKPTAGN